jgi:hypothetical protein
MKIIVYGLGAIGSNLIVQLAKQYPDFEYVGVDFDKVEERNLRTQAYFIDHVVMPKAQAIRVILQRFMKKPRYEAKLLKIIPEMGVINNIGADTYCFDCFDNTASRKLLTPHGDYPIIHLGFSPFYTAEFKWNKDYEVPNDVDPHAGDICSMTDAVSFINMFVNLAVMKFSEFLSDNTKKNFILNHTKVINLQ